MKMAGGSAPGLVLAGGQYVKAELFTFDYAQPVAATARFTSFDVPLTVSGNTYSTGLLIKRGSIATKRGVEVQTLELEITPQIDHPSAPVLVNGQPFLQACRWGFLDSCRVRMDKLFMATPGDVSAGAVPWFQGRVADVQAGRMSVKLMLDSDLALLNVQMPRNIIQTGCVHRLYDASCTLNPASHTTAGAVSAVATDRTYIDTGLTDINGYFDQGVLTFTSGVCTGVTRMVKRYTTSFGRLTFIQPLPPGVVAADTFSVRLGCDKKQATCSAKFGNLAHFRGYPYVPTPETVYDGGTTTLPSNMRPRPENKSEQAAWYTG
jgi:uncharacterized phage protein (TIGR02218 family)